MKKGKQLQSPQHFSRMFLFLFFFFCFSILLLFSSGWIESQDGWLYLNVSRSIYYQHDAVALPENDYPVRNVHMNAMLEKDGKWHAPGSLGYSLAMVPAVAVSDALHHIYGSKPPHNFPLESDWTVLLFASFTTSFFTAAIALGVLLYAHELGQTQRQAITTSLLSIFATMLLPLSKNSFAHPLFISGLIFSFYFVKRFAVTRKPLYLFFCAVAYGFVCISYNPTYVLPAAALYLYLLSVLSVKVRVRIIVATILLGIAAVLIKPILLVYIVNFTKFNPKYAFEGIYGLLLSPGKSILLYSPILLLLPVFWWKLRRNLRNEAMAFLCLAAAYVFFFGHLTILGAAGQVTPIWYGGLDWGVRYISVVIPFFMILAMDIVYGLERWQKYLLFGPLLIASLWIQCIAVSVPYILQYRDLPPTIGIGATEFSYYEYASFIPRYSPLITQSSEFMRKIAGFKDTINHGAFQVKFYDGFEVPVKTGVGYMRGFRQEGHISFSQKNSHDIHDIALRFTNVSDNLTATSSAVIAISANGTEISQITAPIYKDVFTTLPLSVDVLHQGENKLNFTVTFGKDLPTQHVQYVTQMLINSTNVNLATLDYPDVSASGPKTTLIPYQYYGNKISDPWAMWYLRARINERTFDFWWIKNLYYWDRPKNFFWALFIADWAVILLSGYGVRKYFKMYKKL